METSRNKLLGWLLASALLPGSAAAQLVAMKKMPPLGKKIAAFPEIVAPKNEAERAVNAAVARLDRRVLSAEKSCRVADKTDGFRKRTVSVTMTGPGWLSYRINDFAFCRGAYPNTTTSSIVYDLTTGKPVDWTRLLPAELTGTVALSEGMDGVKVVTLSSDALYRLYLAGYPAGHADCHAIVKDAGLQEPPEMTVWLDAAGDGLGVQIDLPHVVQACAVAVTIPTATLRTLVPMLLCWTLSMPLMRTLRLNARTASR